MAADFPQLPGFLRPEPQQGEYSYTRMYQLLGIAFHLVGRPDKDTGNIAISLGFDSRRDGTEKGFQQRTLGQTDDPKKSRHGRRILEQLAGRLKPDFELRIDPRLPSAKVMPTARFGTPLAALQELGNRLADMEQQLQEERLTVPPEKEDSWTQRAAEQPAQQPDRLSDEGKINLALVLEQQFPNVSAQERQSVLRKIVDCVEADLSKPKGAQERQP